MHGIDRSVPLFFTRVRGTRIPVTLQLVAEVLRGLYPGISSCQLFVSALLLGVSVFLHHVDLLLKGLDS